MTLIKILSLVILALGLCCCSGEASPEDSPMEKVCGGLLGLACEANQYCDFEFGTCGAADQTGICQEIPEICLQIYEPVCGCDGKTYSNSCHAAASSVSIVANGECAE